MNEEVGLALQAWGIGLLTSALVVLPGMTALDGISADPFPQSVLPRMAAFFHMMLPGLLMTFTFGVVLSFPIFLVGLLAALVFKERIARHPLFFASLAPLVTIGLVAVVTVLSRDAEARAFLSILQEVLAVGLRGDSLILAIPVAAGSFYYCLSIGGLERSADSK